MSDSSDRPTVATKVPGTKVLLVLPDGEQYASWRHEGDERWVNDFQEGLTFEDVLVELDEHVTEILHGS